MLEDELAIEPVKAEALRELEEIAEFLRKNPWRSEDCAQQVRPGRRQGHQAPAPPLARAVDAEGKPHPVLRRLPGISTSTC